MTHIDFDTFHSLFDNPNDWVCKIRAPYREGEAQNKLIEFFGEAFNLSRLQKLEISTTPCTIPVSMPLPDIYISYKIDAPEMLMLYKLYVDQFVEHLKNKECQGKILYDSEAEQFNIVVSGISCIDFLDIL